jgi:hypothetical protein
MKISRYEALKTTVRDGGWNEVPLVLISEDSSALVGLDMAGLPPDTENRFTLESSYLSTHCQPFIQVPYPRSETQQFMNKIESMMNYDVTISAREGLLVTVNATAAVPPPPPSPRCRCAAVALPPCAVAALCHRADATAVAIVTAPPRYFRPSPPPHRVVAAPPPRCRRATAVLMPLLRYLPTSLLLHCLTLS